MTRKDLSQLEAAVRDANPLPPGFDLAHSNESVDVAFLVRQRRQIMSGTPDRPPLETKSPADQAPRPPATPLVHPGGTVADRYRPAQALGVAFVLTAIAVGLITLFGPGGEPGVIEQPATTVTQAPPTTQAPATEVPSQDPLVPAASVLSGSWLMYSTEAGLPSGPVASVTVDPSGVAWALAGDNGLYRFDGANWDYVTSLPEGMDGGEWLAASGETVLVETGIGNTILQLDGSQWRDLQAEGVIPPLSPATRRVMPNGDVLIAGLDGMTPVLVRVGSGGIDTHRADREVTSAPGGPPYHWALTITNDGVMWSGGADAVTEFDGNTFVSHEPLAPPVGECCVSPLAADPQGGIWAQMGTDLYRFDAAGWRIHTTHDALPDVVLPSSSDQRAEWAIVPIPDGGVWLFAENGVAHFDGEAWVGYTLAQAEQAGIPIIGRAVYRAASSTGPDGSAWMLSSPESQLRLHRFNGDSWTSAPTPSPGLENRIGHISGMLAIGPDGSAWVASSNGVARFTPGNATSQQPAASYPGVPAAVPALGEGWGLVLSTVPGDPRVLDSTTGFATSAGYYVKFWDDDWALIPHGNESALIDIDVPATGFLTGGPGIVAWANVGPESLTEAQLWVSTDGVDFERVDVDLFVGCAGVPNCVGSEIYAAAAAPDGRVVALAYDPLVWVPDCDCFELNPVALVTEDGANWTRHPVDLLSVLPASWQGAADIRSPLVFVDGRWLTYATNYSDMYNTSAAFFASENGVDWQAVDTGGTFNQAYILGLAANDQGVVAITREAMYWSADGRDWARSSVSDGVALKAAAYDNGYVVVTVSEVDGGPIDSIWYSADGTTWSRTSISLDEPTEWNSVIGDGPNLVAVGVTETNLNGVWRWSD